jgi:hypothetical protein
MRIVATPTTLLDWLMSFIPLPGEIKTSHFFVVSTGITISEGKNNLSSEGGAYRRSASPQNTGDHIYASSSFTSSLAGRLVIAPSRPTHIEAAPAAES